MRWVYDLSAHQLRETGATGIGDPNSCGVRLTESSSRQTSVRLIVGGVMGETSSSPPTKELTGSGVSLSKAEIDVGGSRTKRGHRPAALMKKTSTPSGLVKQQPSSVLMLVAGCGSRERNPRCYGIHSYGTPKYCHTRMKIPTSVEYVNSFRKQK